MRFGKLFLITCVVAGAGACTSESYKAEKELSMLENASGSGNELCAAKRKIADAYLREGNEDKFKSSKLYADVTCGRASLDPDYAALGENADNMMRAVEESYSIDTEWDIDAGRAQGASPARLAARQGATQQPNFDNSTDAPAASQLGIR